MEGWSSPTWLKRVIVLDDSLDMADTIVERIKVELESARFEGVVGMGGLSPRPRGIYTFSKP
jgi:hypothetical protein